MKLPLNNFIIKTLYISYKSYQFYYLLQSTHFIVYKNIPYDHYYEMWYEQFNIGGFGDYSFSSKPVLWLALGLEAAAYLWIFLMKEDCFVGNNINNNNIRQNITDNNNNNNNNNINNMFTPNILINTIVSTLTLLVTLVKYSVFILILYSLFIAKDLHNTLQILTYYP